MNSHRSRVLRQFPKPEQIQPLDLSAQSNPEDQATYNLLRISNEEFDPTDFDLCPPPQSSFPSPNRSSHLEPRGITLRKTNSCGNYQTKKPRVSVVEHYTQCFNISRRKTSFQLSQEEHKDISSKNVLNTSNFLVLTQENYKKIKVIDSGSTDNGSLDKAASKIKQTKNIGSLLRKRNKSLLKQYLELHKQKKQEAQTPGLTKRSSSPTRLKPNILLNCSTSSSAQDQPSSPMRITSPSKIDQQHRRQYKCVNSNFKRAGKVLRYFSKDGLPRQRGK